VPDTPLRAEPPGLHSAVLLGVPAPRRDGGGVGGGAGAGADAPESPPASPLPLPRLRRTGHPDPVVNDAAWERISVLIPERPRRRRNPGRKPLDDRAVLNGILVVLGRRIGFEKLPQELEYGSGMTCWRRLRDWQRAGIWPQIARVLQEEVPGAQRIDFDRVIDSDGAAGTGGEARVARRPRSTTLVRQPSPVAMEFGFTALRRGR
jgi:transposase